MVHPQQNASPDESSLSQQETQPSDHSTIRDCQLVECGQDSTGRCAITFRTKVDDSIQIYHHWVKIGWMKP